MKKSSILLIATALGSGSLSSQIIVNEISANGILNLVEIKNTGADPVDVSNYYLCSYPDYSEFQELTINCPSKADMILEPGEIIVFSGHPMSSAHGELGVYNAFAFTDPTAMESYMEYGQGGHTREVVAVEAGLWTEGDFAPAANWLGGESLAYDGEGITSTDWFVSFPPSPCLDNVGVEEFEGLNTIKLYPNPASEKVFLEGDSKGLVQVIDLKGSVVLTVEKRSFQVILPVSELDLGIYLVRLGDQSVQFRKE